MVNLLEKESEKFRSELEEIERDNQKDFRRRITAGLIGALVGVADYHILKGSFSDSYKSIHSALLGFATYEILTTSLKKYKNPLQTANPREFLKNFRHIRSVLKGTNREEDLIALRTENSEAIESVGLISKLNNRAYLALSEEGSSDAEGFVDIFNLARRRKKKQNLVEKLSWRWAVSITNRSIEKGHRISIADKFQTVCECMRVGRPERAEELLLFSIEDSKSEEERINCLGMYGYFLESQGRLLDSSAAFGRIFESIGNQHREKFSELTGSKNEVLVHKSTLLGRTFAFKTKEKHEEVYTEQEKTKFFSDISPDFVSPLGIMVLDGRPYGATRWAGKFSLKDYMLEEDKPQLKEFFRKGLETILLLHLKSSGRLKEARKLMGEEDYGTCLRNRFLEREGLYSDCPRGISKGLEALDTEMISNWQAVAHGDFHPGNLIIDNAGNICVIDPEKGIVTSPYVDTLTLVENSLCSGQLSQEEQQGLIGDYCINVTDSGIIFSDEQVAKEMHLSGVFQHLSLFGSSRKFAEGTNLSKVRNHHMKRCLDHIVSLEDFGISRIEDLRGLRSNLEDIYCNA